MSVRIQGGAQTDFSLRAESYEALFEHVIAQALADADMAPADIGVIHVGNFCGQMFTGQGQLGAMPAVVDARFSGVPASRHEAACASGGVALLSAMADIEAGRYDAALVIGAEIQRNVPGETAAKHLGSAAWVGHDSEIGKYPWPALFSRLADEYERRYGLQHTHLAAIATKNLHNARSNPLAHTRKWNDDAPNPLIEKWIERRDCAQVSDGAAAVVLCADKRARQKAPRIAGWGHRTSHLGLDDKLQASKNEAYLFPHLRQCILDAYARAGISTPDAIETHDCFSITEYMAYDHFGLTRPGEAWRQVEQPRVPVNAGGGLIGIGHPVGATGVRMLLDAARAQKIVATLNIGGSATTAVSFVVTP